MVMDLTSLGPSDSQLYWVILVNTGLLLLNNSFPLWQKGGSPKLLFLRPFHPRDFSLDSSTRRVWMRLVGAPHLCSVQAVGLHRELSSWDKKDLQPLVCCLGGSHTSSLMLSC